MPDSSMQSLILSELQSLRADYNANARETGERLASLEAGLKTVIGNGAKGRLTLAEEAIQRLTEWRWRVVGMSAGAGAVMGVLAHVLVR